MTSQTGTGSTNHHEDSSITATGTFLEKSGYRVEGSIHISEFVDHATLLGNRQRSRCRLPMLRSAGDVLIHPPLFCAVSLPLQFPQLRAKATTVQHGA